MIISGERLVLREFDPVDFEPVHAYATDSEVVRYMAWGPNSAEATRDYLERAHASAAENPRRTFELAAAEVATGRLVGGLGLHVDGAQAVLGYCFARSAWGKGYATEAARLLIGWGFDSEGIHRVRARCDLENQAIVSSAREVGYAS